MRGVRDSSSTKMCTLCRVVKPRSFFHKSASKSGGVQSRCKVCQAAQAKAWKKTNPERAKACAKAWQDGNVPRRFARILRVLYAITVEDWARMFNAQSGRCAICAAELLFDRTTHVDHCHTTKRVRGLLCARCNKGLGAFADRPEVLRAAAVYVAESAR